MKMLVTDFGAVPDGYTDSTNALHAARDAAYAFNEDLYFPGGTGPYVTSGFALGGGEGKSIRCIGEDWNTKGFF